MITYTDFLNIYYYHCFDISRLADRLPSPTEPMSLSITGQRSDTNVGGNLFSPNAQYSLDAIYLVERQTQVSYNFSASDVQIVVGSFD